MRVVRKPGLLMALLFFACLIAAPAAAVSTILPFREIERGETSGYRYNFQDFAGAELHITDRRSWQSFWDLHTRGISPPPPLPDVRFPQENVIVVLLGYQTTSAGPSIGVKSISRSDQGTIIEVLEDRAPGLLPAITNPFQILVVTGLGKSITFLHIEPGERLCQVQQECPTGHICSRVDPTCQSPITGECRYVPPGLGCTYLYLPVCGCDGVTYSNDCFLFLEGAVFKHVGECS